MSSGETSSNYTPQTETKIVSDETTGPAMNSGEPSSNDNPVNDDLPF